MFNNKTDKLWGFPEIPKRPFAHGFTDGFELGLWDNPFNSVTENEWFIEYNNGFKFGQKQRLNKGKE